MPARHYMVRITMGDDGPVDLPPATDRLSGVAKALETGERMPFASGGELSRLLTGDPSSAGRGAARPARPLDGPPHAPG